MSLSPPPTSSATSFTPSTSPLPSITILTPSTTTASTSNASSDFPFPSQYSFPPFFTLQPNATTRASQLTSWSTLIQSYCRHHRLFSLVLIDALPTPLFTNSRLSKSLSLRDANAILAWMASPEGGRRAEFADTGSKDAVKDGGGGGGKVWIYWRRPEEWAEMLERWVEGTGQKGAVLTLYELVESDAVRREEWAGMEGDMLRKSLNVLVKRGRAQVFGQGEDLGVKFF